MEFNTEIGSQATVVTAESLPHSRPAPTDSNPVVRVTPAATAPSLTPHPSPLTPHHSTWYTTTRDVACWFAALVLLVLATPCILVAALLIKLTSPGPVFYRQTRSGKLGRPFQILKLRTMAHNCEKHSGPKWSTQGDCRITTIGRILRLTHIDELPQLWNVLKGEMALIGPRPERPEFVEKLDRAIPNYSLRMLIRPGITGLAQVRLPADTDLESVKKKLAYDLYYIRCPGPWLDIKISACTALKMAGIPLKILRKLVRLPKVDWHHATPSPLGGEGQGAGIGNRDPQLQPTGTA